jgi:hypothetical protein
MSESFAFREERFTPAEAAACTGLTTTMQRDWRRHGLLPTRLGSPGSFTPLDLAEIRLMLQMRQLGLERSVSRPFAQVAAPMVLFFALADWPQSWAVDGAEEAAKTFRTHLEKRGDSHLRTLAGLTSGLCRYGIGRDDSIEFVPSLSDELDGDAEEVTRILNLQAVAGRIVEAAQRPLFTIVAPESFRK